jgi:TatD DNase family protein
MQLCDTHCHIHSTDYPLDSLRVLKSSIEAGVTKMICVGQDIPDSEVAVAFAEKNSGAWSSIGIHPHEAKKFVNNDTALKEFAHLVKRPKVVAIGECGLDYFYNHSKKQDQVEILK